jgi:F-type H+-transporting ATPase subunit delta
MNKINYKQFLSSKYAFSIFNFIINEYLHRTFEISLQQTFENLFPRADIPELDLNIEFLKAKENINNSILQIVTDELRLLNFLILEITEFSKFLKDPTYSLKKKFDLIKKIFPVFNPTTKAFIKILGEKNHLYLLPEVLENYNRILDEFSGIKHFDLVFSVKPTIRQLNLIIKNLSQFKLLKKKIKILDYISFKMNRIVVKITCNSSLLSGFVVYEDFRKILDLSLKGKLNQILQSI